MDEEQDITVFCAYCSEEIEYDNARMIEIEYDIKDDEKMTLYAVVCVRCGDDFLNPIKERVMSAIMNAKLARIRMPDKEFKPEE